MFCEELGAGLGGSGERLLLASLLPWAAQLLCLQRVPAGVQGWDTGILGHWDTGILEFSDELREGRMEEIFVNIGDEAREEREDAAGFLPRGWGCNWENDLEEPDPKESCPSAFSIFVVLTGVALGLVWGACLC